MKKAAVAGVIAVPAIVSISAPAAAKHYSTHNAQQCARTCNIDTDCGKNGTCVAGCCN
jgi:hypothetical protein